MFVRRWRAFLHLYFMSFHVISCHFPISFSMCSKGVRCAQRSRHGNGQRTQRIQGSEWLEHLKHLKPNKHEQTMCFTRCSHVLTWCSHVFPDSESIYFILLLYLEYPKPRIIKDHPQSFQITTSRKGLALRFGGACRCESLENVLVVLLYCQHVPKHSSARQRIHSSHSFID